MNPNIVQVYILMGLKALSEVDYFEFQRTSDVSKNEIDVMLKSLMKEMSSEKDVVELYNMLVTDVSTIKHAEQIKFYLSNIKNIAFQRAQYFAISYAQSSAKSDVKYIDSILYSSNIVVNKRIPEIDDFVRLSVMSLIRLCPNYVPNFEYKIRSKYADCVLENKDKESTIVVDVKMNIREFVIKSITKEMDYYLKTLDKNSIGVIILNQNLETYKIDTINNERIFILSYNVETNNLYGNQLKNFIDKINSI